MRAWRTLVTDTSTPNEANSGAKSETWSVSSEPATLDVGDLAAFVFHEEGRAGAVFDNFGAVGKAVDGLTVFYCFHQRRDFSFPRRATVTGSRA